MGEINEKKEKKRKECDLSLYNDVNGLYYCFAFIFN